MVEKGKLINDGNENDLLANDDSELILDKVKKLNLKKMERISYKRRNNSIKSIHNLKSNLRSILKHYQFNLNKFKVDGDVLGVRTDLTQQYCLPVKLIGQIGRIIQIDHSDQILYIRWFDKMKWVHFSQVKKVKKVKKAKKVKIKMKIFEAK